MFDANGYVCSLANPGVEGAPKELFTSDPKVIEAFVKAENRPGRGVYVCMNRLRDNARSRCLETVGEIWRLTVDIDFKAIEETPEEVDRRLQGLPEPPTEVRDSGYGRHVDWVLKEPIPRDSGDYDRAVDLLKRLTESLCGDPAVAHPAALLRMPGTHNSKRENPGPVCRTLWCTGSGSDLGDIEEMLDLLQDASQLTRKPRSSGNTAPNDGPRDGPVDVEHELANMEYGPGLNRLHTVQLRCIGARLRQGIPLDDAVAEILEATKRAVANDPRCANWDWKKEENDIARMGCDLIVKAPELAGCLNDRLYKLWSEAAEAGEVRVSVNKYGPYFFAPNKPRDAGQSKGESRDTHSEPREGPSQEGESPEGPRGPKPRIVLEWLPPFDRAKLPRRGWLYGKHYQRRTVSGTIAPGGTGKTSLVMVEAVAMATCRDLLGEQPTERCRVWLHNGEDSMNELLLRLGAICKHYGIADEEWHGWLILTSGNEWPLRVAHGYSDLKVDTALIEEMTRKVLEKEIDVVMLDPLVTLHAVNESDNAKMDAVIRTFTRMSDTCNCAVDISHHTRKLAVGSFDHSVDDMRGASSVRDAVRALRILNLMSKEDASNLGIGEFERLSYFRIDRGKGNTSAPSDAAVWRKFDSITLENDEQVGVVTPWNRPGQGAPTAEQTAQAQQDEELFLHLLDRFAREKRSVSERPGPSYAPKVFSEEWEAVNAKASKARLSAAMRRLFSQKRIRVEEYDRNGRSATRLARAGQKPVLIWDASDA
jgi:RecA-family ATPase